MGSIGRFGSFSFHGTKTLTTGGEGGMFVTNDDDLYETVRTLSNHGRARGQTKQLWPDMVGFKYKMSNVQAAIGCAQLERVDDLSSRKREILSEYRRNLADLPEIAMNPEPPGTINGVWMPTAVFSTETGVSREQLLTVFQDANIEGRVFFWPLTSLPFFGGTPVNPIAADVASRAINLPSFHNMTEDEQGRVIQVLRGVLSGENFRH